MGTKCKNKLYQMKASVLVARKWTTVQTWTSIGLYLHILAWGCFNGSMSSCLLDFELLTSSSTTQVGLMFTATTVVGIIGAPLGGQVLAILDTRLVLGLVSCLFGCTTIVLPWARSFVQLMVFSGVHGFTLGALDTVQNVSSILIWGWKSFVYMQAFHAIYAVGTFIGPLLSRPFLAPVWHFNVTNNATGFNETYMNGNASNSYEQIVHYGESRIMFIFLIVGLYLITIGIFYLSVYFYYRGSKSNNIVEPVENTKSKNVKDENNDNEIRNPNQKKLLYIIPMTLMASMRFGAYVGLEVVYSSFLMTYCVKGLGYTKTDALMVTTGFLGSFAASRIASIIFAMCISPTVYIIIDIILMLVAFISMMVLVTTHPLVIVICSVMIGIAMGSFYGSSMSWAAKYMHITERIGSALTTGSWVGVLALPALAGYVIENFTPLAFIYLCFGSLLIVSVVTLISTFIGLKYGAPLIKERGQIEEGQRNDKLNRVTQM